MLASKEITLKSAHRKCWISLLLYGDGTMTVLYPTGDSGPQQRTDDVCTAVYQQGQSRTVSGTFRDLSHKKQCGVTKCCRCLGEALLWPWICSLCRPAVSAVTALDVVQAGT